MTVIQKAWTLRFHVPGTTTPSAGTKDFDVTNFAEPPHFGGQVVDPSRGTAATVAYRFVVPDLSSIITGNLANPSTGRTDLIGRLVELLESTNGGTAARVFVGRCSALTEPVPGRWQIEVADERWQERQANVFAQATDTVQLYPPGPRYGFRFFPALAETATAKITATASGNRKKLVVSSRWEMTPEVLDWIQRDVIEEPQPARVDGAGNFEHLRLEVNGVSLEVVKFGELDAENVTDRLADTDPKVGQNIPVWVVDPDSDLGTTGASYDDAAFVAPTAPPSDVLPLLVGVEDGSHAYGYGATDFSVWTVVQKLYTAAGVRFDATQFAALKTQGYPKMAWRLRSVPRDLAEWLDTHVYGPLGVVPFTNDQGEISPRSTRLPNPSTFDINAAFEFDADNLTSPPTYDQNAADLINVVRVRKEYLNLVWRTPGFADSGIASPALPVRIASGPADRIFPNVSEETFEHDNLSTVGRREATFDLSGFAPKGEGANTGFFIDIGFFTSGGAPLESARRHLTRELFERWGDGPIRWSFSSFRSGGAESVEPGDFVKLAVDSLPNPATNSRGGTRVVQILGKRPGVNGIEWEAIDAGPSLQPLAAPTCAIVLGSNQKHEVTITVGSLPSGAKATVELALGSGAPFTQTYDGKSAGSFTVRGLPSNTLIRARSRSTATSRIRSSYSAEDSVTTDALTVPTVATPTVSGWSMDVGVTNNEPGYRLMPVARSAGSGSFADQVRTPLPDNTTFYTFRFAAGSTSYDVGYKVVDPYGGESAVAYQTAATEANPRELDPPERMQVTQGRPAALDPDLPPQELWTGTGLEIGFVPIEIHAETVVQMAAVSNFSTIEREVVCAPGETRVQLYTDGLDKTTRYVRAFHRARGYDDSEFSAVVSALPTALLGNQPPDLFAGGYFQLVQRDDGTLGAVMGTGGDISTDRIYFEIEANPADPDAELTVDESSPYLSVDGASPALDTLPFSGPFPPDTPLDAVEGDVFVARARFWNKKAGFGQDTVSVLKIPQVEPLPLIFTDTDEDGNQIVKFWVASPWASVKVAQSFSGFPDEAAVTSSGTVVNKGSGAVQITASEVESAFGGPVATLSTANPVSYVSAIAYREADAGGSNPSPVIGDLSNIPGIVGRQVQSSRIALQAIVSELVANGAITAEKMTATSQRIASNDVEVQGVGDDQIAWTAGTLRLAGGGTYSIAASTSNVTLTTDVPMYVFFDATVSTTVLQTTEDPADLQDDNVVLIATAFKGAFGDNPATVIPVPGLGGLQVGYQNIAANSIDANRIRAAAVVADKIASNSITSAKIASAQITALHLAANAVTATAIAAGAIVADKIAAGSIDVSKLAAGTLAADNIEAGTITSSVIVASTRLSATTVQIDGTLNIRNNAGTDRMRIWSSGGVDQVLGISNGLSLLAGGGNAVLDASSGRVILGGANPVQITASGSLNTSSHSASGNYLTVLVGATTYYIPLYT